RAFFPAMLSLPATFPVRTDVIARYGTNWAEPGRIVTLGPYLLKSWDHDRKVLLARNDYYYGPLPSVKTIEMPIVNSKETQLSMFDTGRIDQVLNVPSPLTKSYRKHEEFRVIPEVGFFYLGLTVTKSPLNSPL